MDFQCGRLPLKVGGNVRMRAQGTAGDPDGSLAQVVLRAELRGIVELIEDTNVAIRVEPSVIFGQVGRTRLPAGEKRELPGQRLLQDINEMAERYVQTIKECPPKDDDRRMRILFTQAIMAGNNRAAEMSLANYNHLYRKWKKAIATIDDVIQMATDLRCARTPEQELGDLCECPRCNMLKQLKQFKAEEQSSDLGQS
jgi:hypothetical protein